MTSYLIDTYGAPSDAELAMPGCVGASRYISHSSGKNVSGLQVKHIHALGKWVQLNFEDSSTNAKGGLSQGGSDAQFVLAQLHLLATPAGVAVYFSVDFEVHTGQPEMETVLDYFRPIKAALHAAGFLVGAYGDADVIGALSAAGLVDFGWQTVAWSYGKRDPHAVELQDVFTSGYDKDEIESPYIGAWTPTGAQTKPAPSPAPSTDLLEWIMSLPGTPKDLTYQQFVHDIAASVAAFPVPVAPGSAEHAALTTVLSATNKHANDINAATQAIAKKVGA